MGEKKEQKQLSWKSKDLKNQRNTKRWDDSLDIISFATDPYKGKSIRLRLIGPMTTIVTHTFYTKKNGIGFTIGCPKHNMDTNKFDTDKGCPVEDNNDDISGYIRTQKVILQNAIIRDIQSEMDGLKESKIDYIQDSDDTTARKKKSAEHDSKKSPIKVIKMTTTMIDAIQEIMEEDYDGVSPDDPDGGWDVRIKFKADTNKYVVKDCKETNKLTKLEKKYRLYDINDVLPGTEKDIADILEKNGYYDGTYFFEKYMEKRKEGEGGKKNSDSKKKKYHDEDDEDVETFGKNKTKKTSKKDDDEDEDDDEDYNNDQLEDDDEEEEKSNKKHGKKTSKKVEDEDDEEEEDDDSDEDEEDNDEPECYGGYLGKKKCIECEYKKSCIKSTKEAEKDE